MTKKMQLELPDEVYDALVRLTQGTKQSPEQMVTEWILSAANTIEGVSIRASRASRGTKKRAAVAQNTPAPAQTDQAQTNAADTSPRSNQTLAESGVGGVGALGVGVIYEVKVTLLESKPQIWRRIQVPGSITLIKLHRALQVLMGWQDCHLHQFTVNGDLYGMRVEDWQDATPELLDDRGVRLYQIAPAAGTRLVYEYDFGDGWQLEMIIENIVEDIKDASFSQADSAGGTGHGLAHVVCLAAQRAGPPEDVGGIGGYEGFVKAIRNRRHPEHSSWLEWVGGSFDPEKFDLEAVNRALQRIR